MKSILFFLTISGSLWADLAQPVGEIAFGSCLKQKLAAPVLTTLADHKPGVFIWLGDNIYGDTEDMAILKEKYQVVRDNPDYQRLQKSSHIVGTWDDHDYGVNDGGKEYPKRAESQQILLDFLDVPMDSPRRQQEGVYGLHDFGPVGQQVRIILLDTRYHRDPIGSNGTILGEEQWAWLEKSLLESKAQVNILVSSIQVLAPNHRFEKWLNFPTEHERLLSLLARPEVPPVVILSGDRHLAEISVDKSSVGYPLYDLTSSSMNSGGGRNSTERNDLRVGNNFTKPNFGLLKINWEEKIPTITATICQVNGETVREATFSLTR